MAGTKVNTYEITGNDDVDAIEETVDKTNKGKCAVSLTEMDTTVQPQIAAGSVVEVNGALFEFEADESISGTPSDGTVYIKLIPAGSPATLTAQFTATAPVWDDEKQGWYSPTAGEENYRYLPFAMTKSGTSYSSKYEFEDKVLNNKKYANGDMSIVDLTCDDITCDDIVCDKITPATISAYLENFDSVVTVGGSLSTSTVISYPSGFSRATTMMLFFKYYQDANTAIVGFNNLIVCSFGASNITLTVDASLVDKSYQMILAIKSGIE